MTFQNPNLLRRNLERSHYPNLCDENEAFCRPMHVWWNISLATLVYAYWNASTLHSVKSIVYQSHQRHIFVRCSGQKFVLPFWSLYWEHQIYYNLNFYNILLACSSGLGRRCPTFATNRYDLYRWKMYSFFSIFWCHSHQELTDSAAEWGDAFPGKVVWLGDLW